MTANRSAVLLSKDEPLVIQTSPLQAVKAGEAIVKILAVDIVPYMSQILDGSLPYPLSIPMTPGNSAIGRVFEVGPDAVSLKPSQLVYCDITVRARDDPFVTILLGTHGGGYPAAQKLMDGEWRNGTYAEYAKLPLENVYPLNEDLLVNKMGYTFADLCVLTPCLVPFGGLAEVDLKPGEVAIVAPATGRFSGAAVAVALAMGATVIAAGRNKQALSQLQAIHESTGRLRTAVLSDDVDQNTAALKEALPNPEAGADVFIDFSPPQAAGNQLVVSAVRVLRPFGRCAIMGGNPGNITLPYLEVMFKSIRLQGRFMFDRSHVIRLIQMLEAGILKLGKDVGVEKIEEFPLDSIHDALKTASKLSGWGSQVVLKP